MSLNYELKYGTKKHKDILEALRARVKLAETKTSTLRQRMENDELLFHAYMRPEDLKNPSCRDDEDARTDGRDYKEIYVPYSYAILMTMHTYLTSVFLGRAPVFQYTGRHGETQQQIQVMEAMIDYQVQVGKMLPVMYNWLLDPGKYGFGVVGVYWESEEIRISRIIEKPKTYLGIPLAGTSEKVKQEARIKGYEGNRLYNIRPQDFIADPRVSLMNFQKGEFAGRYVQIGWNELVKGQESKRYYNIDVLQKKLKASRSSSGLWGSGGSVTRDTGSGLVELPDLQGPTTTENIKSVDYGELYELVVELIPKDWGLGKSAYPEKWLFTFSLKHGVIVESRPLGYLHNKYPFAILPYEIDAYSISPRSMMEITKPLNDVMTWLVNTHFYNVRRMLNDQIIFDPSKVVLADLLDNSPGRLIRLKPEAYGTDPRLAVHQLNTGDATQGHLRDIQIIGEMLQRVTGVTDNIMGMVNPGGRKTATEVRTSSSFGVNRLKTLAEYMSAVGFSQLSEMMVQNTQQFFTEERMFKVAGDLVNSQTSTTVLATPNDIQGFFDFVPVDGTMPIDRFAQVTMWTQLMGMMQNDPRVMQSYDTGAIFSWVAKLGGLKNIDQFKIKVVDDAALTGQIDKGNLVPVNGGDNNARPNTGESGPRGQASTPENATGVPGASNNGGLGPAG